MIADFLLRLACGLLLALLPLPAGQINPRFYRTHFLTALALTAVATCFAGDVAGAHAAWLWTALVCGLAGAFVGSVVWSLEGAPLGRAVGFLTTLALVAALCLIGSGSADESPGWVLAGRLSSAVLLGASTTAMLMGHSYLIAPSMSLVPLYRLLVLLLAALLVRVVVAAFGLWFWSAEHSVRTLNDVTMLLPLRWVLGLALPLVLGGMAWQTARIRSTQSATGILYVIVIFCYLGEALSQLLFRITDGLVL
jgi:hypothetical protein